MAGYSANQNKSWKIPHSTNQNNNNWKNQPSPTFQVYIKNFPSNWTEQNLDAFFSTYNVKSKIINKPPAQIYAFLTVASYEIQQEVIKNWNGKTPLGHSQPFNIDQAKKKEKKVKQTTPTIITSHPVSPSSVNSYPPSTTKVPVTFEWTQPGNVVEVIGSFFHWNLGNAVPMERKEPKGTFEAVIELEPALYEYRFKVDGEWQSDLTKPMKGENNYIVVGPLLQQPLLQSPNQPHQELQSQSPNQPHHQELQSQSPNQPHHQQLQSQSPNQQHHQQLQSQSPNQQHQQLQSQSPNQPLHQQQTQNQPQPKSQHKPPTQSHHQPQSQHKPQLQSHHQPQSQHKPQSQNQQKLQQKQQYHPKSQTQPKLHQKPQYQQQSQHQQHPKSQQQSQSKPKSQPISKPQKQQQQQHQSLPQQPQLQQQQLQQQQHQHQPQQQPQLQQQQQQHQPQLQQQLQPQSFSPMYTGSSPGMAYPYLSSPIQHQYIPYGTPYTPPVAHPYQPNFSSPVLYPYPIPPQIQPSILPTLLPVTTANTKQTTPEEKKVILTIHRLWSSSGEPFKLTVNSTTTVQEIRLRIYTPPREYQTKFQQILVESREEGGIDQVLGGKVIADDLEGRKLYVTPWYIGNEKIEMETWHLDDLVNLLQDKENWVGISGYSLLSLYLKNVFLLSHENHLIQFKHNTKQGQYHLSWFDTLLYTNNSTQSDQKSLNNNPEEIYCCLKYNKTNSHLVVLKYLKKSQLPQNIFPDKNRQLYTLLRNPNLWNSEKNKMETLFSNLEKLEQFEATLRNSIFSDKILLVRNRPEYSLILEKLTTLFQRDILVRENDLKRELIRPEIWRNITEQQYSEIVRHVDELSLGGGSPPTGPDVSLSDTESDIGSDALGDPGEGEETQEQEEIPFGIVEESPPPPIGGHTGRFMDGLERDPHNKPVQFYIPGYLPSHSLHEVLASFGPLGQTALVGAHSKPRDSRLTLEEMALLYLYTMEPTDSSPSVYGPVNATMRDGTPKDHAKYRDFIYYLEEILGKLDSYESPVYRGISVQIPGYRQNITITWPAFSSCTCDPKIANDFIQKEKGTLFIIQSKGAKVVEKYTSMAHEREVLFPPNSRFRVKSVVDFAIKNMLEVSLNKDLSDVVLLHLEEIDVMGGSMALLTCTNCHASFTDKVQFKVHVEECNERLDKYYTCNNCTEKFYSKTDKFYAHINSCNVQGSKIKPQNIRYCRNCSFSTNVFSDWQTHIRACNGVSTPLGTPWQNLQSLK